MHSDGIWKFLEKITRNLAVQDKFNTQDTGNRHISVSFYFHCGNVLWQQRLRPFNRRTYKTSLTIASFCGEKLPRELLSVIMNDFEFWFRPSRDDNFKCLDLTPLKYHLLKKIHLSFDSRKFDFQISARVLFENQDATVKLFSVYSD